MAFRQFFLQPPLTHSTFNCDLNNAEEEIEQDQGVCCTLNVKDGVHTCFPRQSTAIITWVMQNLWWVWYIFLGLIAPEHLLE